MWRRALPGVFSYPSTYSPPCACHFTLQVGRYAADMGLVSSQNDPIPDEGRGMRVSENNMGLVSSMNDSIPNEGRGMRVSENQNSIRIGIIGEQGVGKSSLMRRLLGKDNYNANKMDMNVDYAYTTLHESYADDGGQGLFVELFDFTGDVRKVKQLQMLHQVHGFIFVYDVKSHKTLSALESKWLTTILLDTDNPDRMWNTSLSTTMDTVDHVKDRAKVNSAQKSKNRNKMLKKTGYCSGNVNKLKRHKSKESHPDEIRNSYSHRLQFRNLNEATRQYPDPRIRAGLSKYSTLSASQEHLKDLHTQQTTENTNFYVSHTGEYILEQDDYELYDDVDVGFTSVFRPPKTDKGKTDDDIGETMDANTPVICDTTNDDKEVKKTMVSESVRRLPPILICGNKVDTLSIQSAHSTALPSLDLLQESYPNHMFMNCTLPVGAQDMLRFHRFYIDIYAHLPNKEV